MLRIMRLPAADLRPELRAGLEGLNDFVAQLPVTDDAKSLIALCQFDGDFINFYAKKQGGVELLLCGEGGPQFTVAQSLIQYNYQNRREVLLNSPVDPPHPAAGLLKQLLLQPQHLVVIDHTEPVIVPFLDKTVVPLPPKAASTLLGAGVPGVGTAAATFAGADAAGAMGAGVVHPWLSRLLGGLLVLLILLGLGLAYYKFLYPWPWVREEQVVNIVRDLQRQEAEQAALLKYPGLREQIANKIDQIYSAQGDKEAQGPVQALALLEELQDKDRALELEAQGLVDGVKQALEYLEQAQAQDAEAKDVEQTQTAAPVVSQPPVQAKTETQAQAKDTASAQSAKTDKALPKCETIRKAGTLPKLMLAVDGSGSMTVKMQDGQLRINSAIKAAHTLIDRVDKNVNIQFYGIQGCPFARDYGSFTNADRPRLKGLIKGLDPRKYPQPGFIFTPLVSAIQSMAHDAPSNADSVGIIISDGLDTCYDAPGFNICSLAQQIHASKPRLKIHVIYIGDPVDINEIKCVPQVTKGKIFSPKNTQSLIKDIESASQTLVRVCQ